MLRLILRIVAVLAAAAAVTAGSVAADRRLPPADVGQPRTLYVDPRIGDDANSGRLPEEALATLTAALRQVRDPVPAGARILVMGYGDKLVSQGTGQRCPTVRGTARHPVVISANVYTNTLYPVVLTTRTAVTGRWRPVRDAPGGQVWVTRWDRPVRLTKIPSHGLVQVGQVGLDAYRSEPAARAGNATWWREGDTPGSGRLFVRIVGVDPNRYTVMIKDGDAICLSGRSRHVRIRGLAVDGAVHAIRVEPGARDIAVHDVLRRNVLDEDVIPAGAR